MADTKFSHQKANSPEAQYTGGGLRSFFVYRDTGVTPATNGKLRVPLVRAAARARRRREAPVCISILPISMASTWSAAGPDLIMTASIRWSRPATVCTSGRESSIICTTGRRGRRSRRERQRPAATRSAARQASVAREPPRPGRQSPAPGRTYRYRLGSSDRSSLMTAHDQLTGGASDRGRSYDQ